MECTLVFGVECLAVHGFEVQFLKLLELDGLSAYKIFKSLVLRSEVDIANQLLS
jgi:hypothetical protein